MGTKPWDGVPLYSGYPLRLGGKEAEIDSQIPSSQMPTITGDSQEADDADENMMVESSQPGATSFLLQALKEPKQPPPKYVAPVNFYAAAAPKPKPKGPLLVSSLLFLSIWTEFLLQTRCIGARRRGYESAYKRAHKEVQQEVGLTTQKSLSNYLQLCNLEIYRSYQSSWTQFLLAIYDRINKRVRHLWFARSGIAQLTLAGVKFLYECVMGLRKHEGQGCILADEM